jgi:thioredoxin-related protein
MKNLSSILFVLSVSLFQSFNSLAIQFSINSIDESLKTAKESNKFVLVYFYSTSCSHCVYMEKNVFFDSELTKLVDESFIAVKSNSGNTIGRMEYYEYGITAHPTLLVLNSNGIEISRLKGRQEIVELSDKLKELVSNKEQNMKAQPFIKDEDPLESEPGPENRNIRNTSVTRQKY